MIVDPEITTESTDDIITASSAANPIPTSQGGNKFCIREKIATSGFGKSPNSSLELSPKKSNIKEKIMKNGIVNMYDFLAIFSFFDEVILCQVSEPKYKKPPNITTAKNQAGPAKENRFKCPSGRFVKRFPIPPTFT